MSDTPISDSTPHNVAELGMLCRKLERQLNAANERIKLLKSSGNELLEWVKDGTISDSNYRLLANAWQRAKENKP
jgi:hypothetical protein